jgi:hypothetical protein
MARVRLYLVLWLTLLFHAAVGQATLPTPVILHRSAPWQLDYDVESCKLFGVFGTGNDAIFMRLTRFRPGDGFNLVLFGKALGYESSRSEMSLNFGPGGQLVSTKTMNGWANNLPMRMIEGWRLDNVQSMASPGHWPTISPEQESATQYLDLDLADSRYFRLDLVSMGPTMAALRKCTDVLVRSWGFDPAQQSSLQRKPSPKNSPAEWISRDAYPASALRNQESGIVHFRVDVDETGAVAGCHVQFSARQDDSFSQATCQQLKARARFDPALDAAGKPIKSYFVSSIYWRMP